MLRALSKLWKESKKTPKMSMFVEKEKTGIQNVLRQEKGTQSEVWFYLWG